MASTEAKVKALPEPVCCLGYPESQVKEILGDREPEFMRWMRGQTMAGCDGWTGHWNEDCTELTRAPSGCGPHGGVVYAWDLARFLSGLPVID